MSEDEFDDYLWDGSGEPDAVVNAMEELLRPLRYARPLRFPDVEDGARDSHADDPSEEH